MDAARALENVLLPVLPAVEVVVAVVDAAALAAPLEIAARRMSAAIAARVLICLWLVPLAKIFPC